MRKNGKLWLVPLLPVCFWPLAAGAQDGEAANVFAECGAADLPQATLDSCLERVRVLEETDSSAELQRLEATLEQRETGHPVRTQSAAAAPRMMEVAGAPSAVAEEDGEPDKMSPPPEQPDSVAPPSGAALDDEPPVSDAPDAAVGTDPAAEGDTGDPPRR